MPMQTSPHRMEPPFLPADFRVSVGGQPIQDRALVDVARLVAQTGYHFTTVTPETHRRVIARNGNGPARNLRDIFGWSLPFDETLVSAELFDALQAAGILVPSGGLWRSTIRLSSLDGLLFIHSSYPTDQAASVFFGPDTYRFAAAIKAEIAQIPSIGRALDIGAGSGAGGILLARHYPHAEILLSDINAEALRLSGINARLAGTANARPLFSDLFSAINGTFDLIVANPPYLIDPLERVYRHGGGQWGAGLSLRIATEAIRRLNPGGSLLLYTGTAIVDGDDPFKREVLPLIQTAGLAVEYREIDPDVFGEELAQLPYRQAERIAVICLTARTARI